MAGTLCPLLLLRGHSFHSIALDFIGKALLARSIPGARGKGGLGSARGPTPVEEEDASGRTGLDGPASSPGEATGLAGGTGGATGWFTDEPVSSVSQEDSRKISISRVSSFQLEEPPEGAIILVKPSPVSTARKAKATVKASPAEQQQPTPLRAKDMPRENPTFSSKA